MVSDSYVVCLLVCPICLNEYRMEKFEPPLNAHPTQTVEQSGYADSWNPAILIQSKTTHRHYPRIKL